MKFILALIYFVVTLGVTGGFVEAASADDKVLHLDNGHLTFTLPNNITSKQRKVNFETSQYDFSFVGASKPFLTVVDGGGAYDLHGFKKSCLNGRSSWQSIGSGSGTVVAGEPGSWAVAAYWTNLSGHELQAALAIVNSLTIDFGPRC